MTEHTLPDIGGGLRLARERAGVSLRQIADVTKLPVRALDALERNRIGQLPGGIYRRAIVRAYASEVGLDPEQTLRTFLQQYPDDVPTLPPTPAAPPPERPVLRVAMRMLSAMIPMVAAVVYVGFARHVEEPRTDQRKQALSNDLIRRHNAAVAVAARELPGQDDEGAVPMMISISSPTDLAVVADGGEVVARRLDAGEVLHVRFRDDVRLRAGDGGAVHFSINGRAGRSLGTAGAPLDLLLTRHAYQDWLVQP